MRIVGPLAVVVALAVSQASAASSPGTESAMATLLDGQGKAVGEAVLTQTPQGVLVTATLHDLPPGLHAVHVHEHGACVPPFTTAGGHFNPAHRRHGFENPRGAHAGDLPNVDVPENGKTRIQLLATSVTLRRGAPNSLLDRDGSALVVHAGPDDYRTDPAGNSGDRLACGVVDVRATEPAGAPPRSKRSTR